MPLIFALLCFASLPAFAQYTIEEVPFDPAYAADQPQIDFQSLTSEFQQFQQLNNYYGTQSQLAVRKSERNKAKRAYARAADLYKKGAVAKAEMQRAYHTFQVAEGEVARLESQMQKVRASAELNKLVLLQTGNSDSDLRKDIGSKLKDMVEIDLKGLEIARKTAVISRNYLKSRWDNSEKLCKGGTLTEVECEQRLGAYRISEAQLSAIQAQEKTMAQSLDAIKRTLKRLFDEPVAAKPLRN